LGCKVNTFDSNALASGFRRLGFSVTTAESDEALRPVLILVNTCTILVNNAKLTISKVSVSKSDHLTILHISNSCRNSIVHKFLNGSFPLKTRLAFAILILV
jgi:tRNA A37 methylthiotransferase MiaB